MSPAPADLLIRGGAVIDGTGKAPLSADVAIKDGRIACVEPRWPGTADRVLEAAGLWVAPGFIDIHSHSDFTLLADPRAMSSIAQGVTLEVVGNCGHGCAPLVDPTTARMNVYGYAADYPIDWRSVGQYLERLQERRPAVNVLTLVPNGRLRLAVAGLVDRPSTPDELRRMKELPAGEPRGGRLWLSHGSGIRAGAGLLRGGDRRVVRPWWPSAGACTPPIRAIRRARTKRPLPRPSARLKPRAWPCRFPISRWWRGGPQNGVRAGRGPGAGGPGAAGRAGRGLRYAHAVVRHDESERGAAARGAGGRPGRSGRRGYAIPSAEPAGGGEWGRTAVLWRGLAQGDWQRILLSQYGPRPELAGQSLADIGRDMGLEPVDLYLRVVAGGAGPGPRADDPSLLLPRRRGAPGVRPPALHGRLGRATALCPDGPLQGAVFHGAYTWAGWFFPAFCARGTGLLSPEAAVHRLTGAAGRSPGSGRTGGRSARGAWADLAVFDGQTFRERGTVAAPNLTARGMVHVLVNGVPTLEDGAWTGARGRAGAAPGRMRGVGTCAFNDRTAKVQPPPIFPL